MEKSKLIEYFDLNFKFRIFEKQLNFNRQQYYILYQYDYHNELKSFKETFLYYLPFYVQNDDMLEMVDGSNDTFISSDLIKKSKWIWENSIIMPHRKAASNGIFGELFLDFFLRVVKKRKLIMTYASKREFNSNMETKGLDNVAYSFDENGQMHIYFCEAKFLETRTAVETQLIEDIIGAKEIKDSNGEICKKEKIGHVTKDFLNKYIQFIVEKGDAIETKYREVFKEYLNYVNKNLSKGVDFVTILNKFGICVDFIFFAEFCCKKKDPAKFKKEYCAIYKECQNQVSVIGLEETNIEIVFIPIDNKSMTVKNEICKQYE